MNQSQTAQLDGKLEECLLTGHAFISWAQIYTWYRADRIGRRTWRDIEARWEQICEDQRFEPAPPLEVWGLGPKANLGGIRLRRAYLVDLDGEKWKLSELSSGD